METSNTKKRIRVGLLMNSYQISQSYYQIIETLTSCGYAEINLVVLNKTRSDQKKLTFSKIIKRYNFGFFYIYQKIDQYLFGRKISNRSSFDSQAILEQVPVLNVAPVTGKFTQQFADADIDMIRSHNIDVLIRMGFKILKGDILFASKYGVWSYHHADNKVNRGGPPCFWEMYERNPVTGTIVQVLSNDLDNGKVIYRSFGATHKYSMYLSRKLTYAKATRFIPALIEKLYNEGDSFLEKEDTLPAMYSHRLYTTPTNFEMVKFLTRLKVNTFLKLVRNTFYRNQWFLMYHISKENNIQSSIRKMKELRPNSGTMWADPHIIYKDGVYNIFIEEKFFKNKIAHISLIKMSEEGVISKPEIVLKQPYHLSYPFVFEYQNEYYMIPESRSNKSIELYQAKAFPYQWEKVKVLMDNINAVDTTLFQYNNTWWMFINMAFNNDASTNDELYVFYADSPLGEWVPHRCNPVKSDVRNSRPAGKIFEYNKKLYRPAQDCSNTYGYGIRFNEIIKLTETEYIEKEVDFVEPLWNNKIRGIHSFAFENKLTMVDAFRKIPKWG